MKGNEKGMVVAKEEKEGQDGSEGRKGMAG